MAITHSFKKNLINNKGFTLLEITIVVVIISVLSLLIIPRISSMLDSKRNNFFILTTVMAKTFEDSFTYDRTNFLVIHLHESMDSEEENEVFSRPNGVSVVTMDDEGKFVDSKNRYLKYKEFPDSFKIEEVILSTGEKVGIGNVMIPYYPKGYSDNVILHILVDDEEQWSVRIFKLRKEAEIFPDYIDFSSNL